MSVELDGLTKVYNPEGEFPVRAVDAVSARIEPGELVAVMGPSGSGKTTLLNLIGGIDRPTSGRVTVAGTDLTTLSERRLIAFRRDRIGFVFQDFSLLPVLTALENVEFVMRLQGRPGEECERRAGELLAEVGLAERAGCVPARLSGGQQQRVAVARALAARPALVLADEPTASLDARAAHGLLDIMERLNEREGTTFVFSTHDPRVIERARRVIVFEDGRIAADRRR